MVSSGHDGKTSTQVAIQRKEAGRAVSFRKGRAPYFLGRCDAFLAKKKGKLSWEKVCGDRNEFTNSTMEYDKTKFALYPIGHELAGQPARPPKSNRIMSCGCEQEEVVEQAGYIIWQAIKSCEEHE